MNKKNRSFNREYKKGYNQYFQTIPYQKTDEAIKKTLIKRLFSPTAFITNNVIKFNRCQNNSITKPIKNAANGKLIK